MVPNSGPYFLDPPSGLGLKSTGFPFFGLFPYHGLRISVPGFGIVGLRD